MNRITPVVLLALLVLLGSYVIVFEMMPSTRLKWRSRRRSIPRGR